MMVCPMEMLEKTASMMSNLLCSSSARHVSCVMRRSTTSDAFSVILRASGAILSANAFTVSGNVAENSVTFTFALSCDRMNAVCSPRFACSMWSASSTASIMTSFGSMHLLRNASVTIPGVPTTTWPRMRPDLGTVQQVR